MSENLAAAQFKQTCLRLFVCSVLATAATGAIALLIEPQGWWGEVQAKVLGTCAILTGCSFCGLVCGGFYVRGYRVLPSISMASIGFASLCSVLAVWEFIGETTCGRLIGTDVILTVAALCSLINLACYKLGNQRLPRLGMLFVSLAAFIAVLLVWEVFHTAFPFEGHWLFKAFAITTTIGAACTHLAMLLLMKLHRVYAWVQVVAYFAVLGLASYVSLLFLFEGGWMEEETIFRTVGIWSIAVTAVSLIIPVLAYLSRTKLDNDGESTAALERRITSLRAELQRLEARLAELPPAPPKSPWDTPDSRELLGEAHRDVGETAG